MEEEGLSELEWVELGRKVKSIRDRLMDACVLCCNRFGKSGLYPLVKRVDVSFLMFRSKLDSFVCGAYPPCRNSIGPENTQLTHVFFGDTTYQPLILEPARKKHASFFTEEHSLFLSTLIANLEEIIVEILSRPYLAWKFELGTNQEIVDNLKKRIVEFKHKL